MGALTLSEERIGGRLEEGEVGKVGERVRGKIVVGM